MAEKLPANCRRSVRETIARISASVSHIDPLLDPEVSRMHTLTAAALTHHGYVMQGTLRAVLEASRFLTVVSEPELFIAPMVDEFVQGQPLEACLNSQLPYEPIGRRLRPDMLVIDHRYNAATYYELRRAASPGGSGKWGVPNQDVRALRVIAASYARNLGYRVTRGSAYLIAYYGGHRMPPQLVLTRADLDRHFNLSIVEAIEAMTLLYQHELRKIMPRPRLVIEWLGSRAASGA
jgi:hypothetical protein